MLVNLTQVVVDADAAEELKVLAVADDVLVNVAAVDADDLYTVATAP